MVFRQLFIWHLSCYEIFCKIAPFVDILQNSNFSVIFMLWQKGLEIDSRNIACAKNVLEKYSKGAKFVVNDNIWQSHLEK